MFEPGEREVETSVGLLPAPRASDSAVLPHRAAAQDTVSASGVPAAAKAPYGSAAPVATHDDGPLSAPVRALVDAVDAVLGEQPAELPDGQALADTRTLITSIERLRASLLGRVADVDARRLHLLDGVASTASWVDQQQTSLGRGEVALARRMSSLPRLDAAVRNGQLSVAAAERVGRALAALRRHVDRADGQIDGQDGDQALLGVIGSGVVQLVCQALGGLDDADERLAALVARCSAIMAEPVGQLVRLEAAFVLLATELEPALLPSALGQLVDALLPNELEKRVRDGHDRRGLSVRRNADGSGWHVSEGELDLECGELLDTVLRAAMAVDRENPADTAAYEQLRHEGWTSADGPDGLPACGGPRSRRQRTHDALALALRSLLDSGALGVRGKVAPHVVVTVGLDTLHDAPGSLPAVAGSGARLPAALVRTWLCDSRLTRFVLGLGGRVVETSHTARTLTGRERQIKQLETGGRCQAAGCRRGPGSALVPHHAVPWHSSGRTGLTETVLFCEQTHADLHVGRRAIRLRDGRWLDENGWTTGPNGP